MRGKKIEVNYWDRYERLSIIREDWKWSDGRMFICQCDCWKQIRTSLHCLRRWYTKSCWCLAKEKTIERQTKHWKTKSNIMYTWEWIQQRCNNPNYTRYKDYGWRWIKCEWETFEQFYKDMWDRPTWKTLDRINNNWNYCKENCRWSDLKTQANNTRKNRYITYKWKTQTMKKWSEELWIPYNRINTRLNTYKWEIEKVFS